MGRVWGIVLMGRVWGGLIKVGRVWVGMSRMGSSRNFSPLREPDASPPRFPAASPPRLNLLAGCIALASPQNALASPQNSLPGMDNDLYSHYSRCTQPPPPLSRAHRADLTWAQALRHLC